MTTTSVSDDIPFRFFELPKELRLQIYNYLPTSRFKQEFSHGPLTTPLRACHQWSVHISNKPSKKYRVVSKHFGQEYAREVSIYTILRFDIWFGLHVSRMIAASHPRYRQATLDVTIIHEMIRVVPPYVMRLRAVKLELSGDPFKCLDFSIEEAFIAIRVAFPELRRLEIYLKMDHPRLISVALRGHLDRLAAFCNFIDLPVQRQNRFPLCVTRSFQVSTTFFFDMCRWVDHPNNRVTFDLRPKPGLPARLTENQNVFEYLEITRVDAGMDSEEVKRVLRMHEEEEEEVEYEEPLPQEAPFA